MAVRSHTKKSSGGSAILNGMVAFLTGLAVMGMFFVVEGGFRLTQLFGLRFIFLFIIGIFYAAHPIAGDGTATFLGATGTTIPGFVYLLVPIVLMFVSGRRSAPSDGSLVVKAAKGAGISAGYLIMTVLSYFAILFLIGGFGVGMTGFGTGIGGDLITLIGTVGLVNPIIFGALGGATA